MQVFSNKALNRIHLEGLFICAGKKKGDFSQQPAQDTMNRSTATLVYPGQNSGQHVSPLNQFASEQNHL